MNQHDNEEKYQLNDILVSTNRTLWTCQQYCRPTYTIVPRRTENFWTSKLYKYVDKDDIELSNEEKALLMCLFLSFGLIAFLLVQGSMILLGVYKLRLIFLQHMGR